MRVGGWGMRSRHAPPPPVSPGGSRQPGAHVPIHLQPQLSPTHRPWSPSILLVNHSVMTGGPARVSVGPQNGSHLPKDLHCMRGTSPLSPDAGDELGGAGRQ